MEDSPSFFPLKSSVWRCNSRFFISLGGDWTRKGETLAFGATARRTCNEDCTCVSRARVCNYGLENIVVIIKI